MSRSFVRFPSAVVSMALISLAGAACSKTSSSPSAAAPAQSCSPSNPSQNDGTTTTSIENATALAFTNTALSLPAAQCGLAVVAAEQSGAPVPLLSDHNLALTSTSTTGFFYSDAACTTKTTTVDLALGVSSGTFYYADTTAGAPTLTATDTNSAPLTAATQAETILAGSGIVTGTSSATSGTGSATVTTSTGGVTTTGSATTLALTAAASTLTRNTCNQVTITLTNASGAAIAATGVVEMLLTTSTQTGSYFNDSSCRTQIAIALITPGFSSVSAFYAEQSQGSVTLAATPAVTTSLTGAVANFIFQ